MTRTDILSLLALVAAPVLLLLTLVVGIPLALVIGDEPRKPWAAPGEFGKRRNAEWVKRWMARPL